MTRTHLKQLKSLLGEIEDAERRRQTVAAWSLFVEDEAAEQKRVELVRQIGRHLEAVPDAIARRALKLRYVDGLPWSVVAVRMGYRSEAGARSLCDRCLQKIDE